MPRPDLAAVPPFYHNYVNLAEGDDVVTALAANTAAYTKLLQTVPDYKWNFAYVPGKWTVKEVILHISDAERIFCYRALSFARGETAAQPGFDENRYAAASKAAKRSAESLVYEALSIRNSTEILFSTFDDDQLSATGTANGNTIGVAAIGFIIAGHAAHHLRILSERYGL